MSFQNANRYYQKSTKNTSIQQPVPIIDVGPSPNMNTSLKISCSYNYLGEALRRKRKAKKPRKKTLKKALKNQPFRRPRRAQRIPMPNPYLTNQHIDYWSPQQIQQQLFENQKELTQELRKKDVDLERLRHIEDETVALRYQLQIFKEQLKLLKQKKVTFPSESEDENPPGVTRRQFRMPAPSPASSLPPLPPLSLPQMAPVYAPRNTAPLEREERQRARESAGLPRLGRPRNPHQRGRPARGQSPSPSSENGFSALLDMPYTPPRTERPTRTQVMQTVFPPAPPSALAAIKREMEERLQAQVYPLARQEESSEPDVSITVEPYVYPEDVPPIGSGNIKGIRYNKYLWEVPEIKEHLKKNGYRTNSIKRDGKYYTVGKIPARAKIKVLKNKGFGIYY